MTAAHCDRHWLIRLARVVAVNCVSGAIPAAFLLMIDSSVSRVDLLHSVIAGAIFANAIGLPANYLMPRWYPRIARRGTLREWTGITPVLIGLAVIGCLIGTAAIAALGMFPWPEYWIVASHNFLICIFITLAFGLVFTAFGRMRGRVHQQELERQRATNLATEARLASLESRIHPHFLFNTVNSISALIPVDPERAEAPPDLRALLAQLGSASAAPRRMERIASRTGDKLELVDLARVSHFYASDKLTCAATAERSYSVDPSITELESRLDPARFSRIHRATILNLDHLRELHTWFGGKMVARLKDSKKTELAVSRDRVRALKDRSGFSLGPVRPPLSLVQPQPRSYFSSTPPTVVDPVPLQPVGP